MEVKSIKILLDSQKCLKLEEAVVKGLLICLI